jgi:hypothetical protein
MKHRLLLHSLSHTVVVVDITEIGPPTEIYPREGKRQLVPSFRFQSWKDADAYFLQLGADPDLIEKAAASIQKAGVAVLSIP